MQLAGVPFCSFVRYTLAAKGPCLGGSTAIITDAYGPRFQE